MILAVFFLLFFFLQQQQAKQPQEPFVARLQKKTFSSTSAFLGGKSQVSIYLNWLS